MILTIDLGTSTTKAALWDEDGLRAVGRTSLTTVHDGPGRAEQDSSSWWPALVDAVGAAVAAGAEGGAPTVDAIVFAAARQTFVPVTAAGDPLGRALVWSDRRGAENAEALALACGGGEAARQRTGIVLDGASVAAKVSWLARHEPERLEGATWIVSPRDLMAWELTGAVRTDVTLASATGLYDADGLEVPQLVAAAAGKLPDVVSSSTVVGELRPEPAAALGLRAGVPVIIGAGDRACEVLGAAASASAPMVAWGTTANVSVPVAQFPVPAPAGVVVTRGALGGWLLEGGLSAAGSLLAWLADLMGVGVDELMAAAAASPPGAHGVVALPWMGGARAPWWRDDATAGFGGLGFENSRGDLARAAMEAVAFDVARCLEAMTDDVPAETRNVPAETRMSGVGAKPVALAIGTGAGTGTGDSASPWLEILTGVTGLIARQRRSGEGAMAGAVLIASAALDLGFELDRFDPVVIDQAADPDLVRRYGELRPIADAAAATALGLA